MSAGYLWIPYVVIGVLTALVAARWFYGDDNETYDIVFFSFIAGLLWPVIAAFGLVFMVCRLIKRAFNRKLFQPFVVAADWIIALVKSKD